MKTNNPNSLIVTQADNCAANQSASKPALFAVLLLNRWVGNNRCASQTFKKLASRLPLSLMLMQVQIPPAQAAPLIQQCSNITFQEDVTLGGSYPYDITVGDFNSDGKQDLVTVNYRDDTVSVLLGNGNSTFKEQATFGVGFAPSFLTVGDFNGDGKQDLVTASDSSNNVSVLLGNGNSTFQKQATFGVGSYPSSVTVGDFNGDGKQDLATAHAYSNTAKNVSVLLGNGNGSFQKQATFGVGSYPNDITVGDFNRDGKQDLVTTSYSPNNVSVRLGNQYFSVKPKTGRVKVVPKSVSPFNAIQGIFVARTGN